MKRLILALAAVAFTVSATAQKQITIKGKVEFTGGKQDFTVQVKEKSGDKATMAQTTVKPNGEYLIKMEVKKPGLYSLDCGGVQWAQIWAEDENLEVNFRGVDTAAVKSPAPFVSVKGGAKANVINQYHYDIYRTNQIMNTIAQTVKNTNLNADEKKALSTTLNKMNNNERTQRTMFLIENYGDMTCIIALLPSISDQALLNKTIAALEAKYPNYAPLAEYKKNAAEAKARRERMAVGKQVPDFSFKTADGDKTLGPQDFRGKFLVIDFWASWCGPCRAELPNMKAIYADYKDKGVELFGVSIDSKDADWKKALAEENMSWPQVCAPNAGKELMADYQFSMIPFVMLLDKNGNILAKGLRGEKTRQAIEDALSGKLVAPKAAVPMGGLKK